MRIIRNPELKGILVLFSMAAVLGLVLLMLTGTFTDWTGIRITLKKPLANKIVFVSDKDGHPNIWVMDQDGSKQKQLTKGDREDSSPVIAPDGYSIVFVSRQGTEQSQIYAMDADGSHLHRITKITGSKSNLRFNSDGKEILFLCAGEIWRVGPKGQMPQRVLPTEREAAMNRLADEKSPCIWAERSYDGRLLAAVRSTGESELVVLLKPEDEVPKPIALPTEAGAVPLSGEKVFAAWAPDGSSLAITLNDEDGKGTLIMVDTGDETAIPVPVMVGGPMGTLAWSPDGDSLAFQALKRVQTAEYEPIGLLVVDLIEKQVRPLVDAPVTQFSWSPDSRNITYVQAGDIHLVDVESGETKNLTNRKGSNSSPTWAPAE